MGRPWTSFQATQDHGKNYACIHVLEESDVECMRITAGQCAVVVDGWKYPKVTTMLTNIVVTFV